MTRAIIGIDPGLHGAIAVLWPDGHLDVRDTPTAVVKKTKREYLTGGMAAVVREVVALSPDATAVLERGIAMPRQSSSTTYTTGRGGGLWEGLLAGMGVGYELVEPRKWKRAMGLVTGADKGASRVLAQRLFPKHAELFSRVKDDGRAEAALMAEFGRRNSAGGE